MKSTITASTFLALVGTSAAFTVAPATVGNQVSSSSSSSLAAFGKKKAQAVAVPTQAPNFRDELIGALDPIGFFDPLGFADKANDNILRQYREAELTHGRVASKLVLNCYLYEVKSRNCNRRTKQRVFCPVYWYHPFPSHLHVLLSLLLFCLLSPSSSFGL